MFESNVSKGGRYRRAFTPVTYTLLALNIAIYLLQYHLLPRFAPHSSLFDKFDSNYYALSIDGLRAGHWWQLITYQFLHGSALHIFANAWAIFMFGPVVELTLGKVRMLTLYLLSGIAGGLLQILCMWAWPNFFGDEPLIGASAAAYGLVAAFVALFPRQRLLMLLLFIIPMAMRARTLLWVCAIFSVIGIFYPLLEPFVDHHLTVARFIDSAFVNIGHAAHLGGMAIGLLLALGFRPKQHTPPVVDIDPKTSLKTTFPAE
jgi:membrane associated rhomboid family serine protease